MTLAWPVPASHPPAANPAQAFFAAPFQFVNVVGVIVFWIKGRLAATERAKARLWQEQYSQYGTSVSKFLPSVTHAHKQVNNLRRMICRAVVLITQNPLVLSAPAPVSCRASQNSMHPQHMSGQWSTLPD